MSKVEIFPNLREIAGLFDMRADFVGGVPYGNGHINDTFSVDFDQAGHAGVRYIFQRINTHVFREPEKLMANISRVTEFSLGSLLKEGCPEAFRRTLTCIPAKDGKSFAVDREGGYWRVYPFIERATGHDEMRTNEQAIMLRWPSENSSCSRRGFPESVCTRRFRTSTILPSASNHCLVRSKRTRTGGRLL